STPLRGNGLNFTENKGQVTDTKQQLRPDVLFNGSSGAAEIYLRKTGISYVASNANEVSAKVETKMEALKNKTKTIDDEKIIQDLYNKEILKVHRVDVDFEGCDPN